VRKTDTLTTIVCRLSENLGASTSRNPPVLSRPVRGLLYLYDGIEIGLLRLCPAAWQWPACMRYRARAGDWRFCVLRDSDQLVA